MIITHKEDTCVLYKGTKKDINVFPDDCNVNVINNEYVIVSFPDDYILVEICENDSVMYKGFMKIDIVSDFTDKNENKFIDDVYIEVYYGEPLMINVKGENAINFIETRMPLPEYVKRFRYGGI